LLLGLKVDDLPIALAWVTRADLASEMYGGPLVTLSDGVLSMAANNLGNPAVLEATIGVLFAWLTDDDERLVSTGREALLGKVDADPDVRRTLLSHLVPRIAAKEHAVNALVFFHDQFNNGEDVEWILGQLMGSSNGEDRQVWGRLARRQFDPSEAALRDPILRACERCPELAEEMRAWRDPVTLDSDEAEEQRRHFVAFGESRERRENRQPQAWAKDAIPAAIERLDRGETAAWWELDYFLSIDEKGQAHEMRKTMQTSALWGELSDRERALVINSAAPFLEGTSPELDRLIDEGVSHRPTLSGFRALMLLIDADHTALDQIPDATWRSWGGVSLAFPGGCDTDEEARDFRRAAEFLYQKAPGAFLDALRRLIEKEMRDHGNVFVLRRLPEDWDDSLAQILLEIASDPGIGNRALDDLLRALIQRKVPGALELAEEILHRSVNDDPAGNANASVAAVAMLQEANDAGWKQVWEALSNDAVFGRCIVEKAASSRLGDPPWFSKLPPEALADMFIWTENNYPDSERVEHRDGRAHEVTASDAVHRFKRYVLEYLRSTGSSQSSAAMKRISTQVPHLDWLKFWVADALREERRHSWEPPTPSQFRRLLADRDKRYVATPTHLLDLVIESLEKLQEQLQGETPAVKDLWNSWPSTSGSRKWRPKDENDLSDRVKRHLDADLVNRQVIVNREVEIRRGGGSQGERTDLHIDAVASDGEPRRLRVIVEVKGCWHAKVRTEMEGQLVGRYLGDNAGAVGLYLVGWFFCPQWDDEDQRNARCRRQQSCDELRSYLEDQARSLSNRREVRAHVLDCRLR
jgi:hypothetical protein